MSGSAFGVGLYGVGLYGFDITPPSGGGDVTTAAVDGSEIVFGGMDGYGVEWSIQRGSDPFGNAPAPRDISGDRAVAHGSWNATEFYGPRAWELSLIVRSPSHGELHRARHRLSAACGLQAFPVAVSEPFFGSRLGWFRRTSEVMWTEESHRVARATLTMQADDPMIRGPQKVASASLPSSSGGLVWPATWPATWTGVIASGLLSLDNDGTQEASVRWRIDGPITNAAIVEVATGRTLRTDLTLGPGEWLEIDTATHRALANGDLNASRRDRVYGDWWDIPPGSTQAQLTGLGGGASTALTAMWNDTWI